MINEHDIADMKPDDYMVGGSHYKDIGIEPWNVVDTWPIDQQIGAYRLGALKYIMRMGHKDIVEQELRKAKHYVEKLIEVWGKHNNNGQV